jgi:hypothetical protein
VEVESDYARYFDPARISNPNGVADTYATRMIVERLPGVGCCIRFTVCVDNDTGPDGIPISSEVVHKIVMPVETFFRARKFLAVWFDREGLLRPQEAEPLPIGTAVVTLQ